MGDGAAKLNPKAMSIADAARLLSATGGEQVTVEMLEANVAAATVAQSERQQGVVAMIGNGRQRFVETQLTVDRRAPGACADYPDDRLKRHKHHKSVIGDELEVGRQLRAQNLCVRQRHVVFC